MKNLALLKLLRTPFDDEGAEALKGWVSLKELYLPDTRITDLGLASIATLQNLEVVYLERTKVTAAGVAKLKAAIPKCNIVVSPEIQAELGRMQKGQR